MKWIARIALILFIFTCLIAPSSAHAATCGKDAVGPNGEATRCDAVFIPLFNGSRTLDGTDGCFTGQYCIYFPTGGGSYQITTTCGGAAGIQTAIGCIHTDAGGFITQFLRLGIGAAGGIAFLLILVGGLQMMTSAGNPEQLMEGRELLTSAITGLLLIILSLFLLRLIGYDILGIPGIGR